MTTGDLRIQSGEVGSARLLFSLLQTVLSSVSRTGELELLQMPHSQPPLFIRTAQVTSFVHDNVETYTVKNESEPSETDDLETSVEFGSNNDGQHEDDSLQVSSVDFGHVVAICGASRWQQGLSL